MSMAIRVTMFLVLNDVDIEVEKLRMGMGNVS